MNDQEENNEQISLILKREKKKSKGIVDKVRERLSFDRILRKGVPRYPLTDVYFHLLNLHPRPLWDWLFFLLVVLAVYVIVGLLFAGIYVPLAKDIDSLNGNMSFYSLFLFSLAILFKLPAPVVESDPLVRFVSIFESFISLMMAALLTGLVFSRFSRPSARVRFSELAVVTDFDGGKALMFRVANERGNHVVGATCHVMLARNESNGFRRLYPLALERDRSLSFRLTWTLIHRIDSENSPLHGATAESLAAQNAELVVLVHGFDNSFAKPLNATFNYPHSQIVWNAKFVDVLTRDSQDRRVFDLTKFHDVSVQVHERDYRSISINVEHVHADSDHDNNNNNDDEDEDDDDYDDDGNEQSPLLNVSSAKHHAIVGRRRRARQPSNSALQLIQLRDSVGYQINI